MAKTSTEKTRDRRAKLHSLANEFGYLTWYRLTTAILRGELLIIKPDKLTEEEEIE